jgi:hypothetical protein
MSLTTLYQHPLARYFLRLIFWASVAFSIWWYSANAVISPILAIIVKFPLAWAFDQPKAQLNSQYSDQWYIQTKILVKRPSSHEKIHVWSLKVGSVMLYSISLPLLWALLLAVPHKVDELLS